MFKGWKTNEEEKAGEEGNVLSPAPPHGDSDSVKIRPGSVQLALIIP